MEKTVKYYLISVVVFLITSILHAENVDKCSTYFIDQPFTSISNPTYDSLEYISITDETHPIVYSSFLESKSRNWISKLTTQKDSSTILLNLLTRSNISMDESLYIISSRILLW